SAHRRDDARPDTRRDGPRSGPRPDERTGQARRDETRGNYRPDDRRNNHRNDHRRDDARPSPRGDERRERAFGREDRRSDRHSNDRHQNARHPDDRHRDARPYGDRRREDARPAPRRDDARREDTRRDGVRSAERRPAPRRDERPAPSWRNERPAPSRRDEPRGGSGPFAERRGGVGSRPRSFGKPKPSGPTPKDPTLPAREGERIAKLLARAGVASRREAERLIAEGRVKQGETVIDTPSTVLTSLQGVTVDGNPVKEAEATRLFAFHKPAGLITAERDPAGRPTIYTALRNALPANAGRVMPVGRLDFNTEGLLLLTNDGEFKRALELPSSGIPRTYRARAFGDITQEQLESLIEGVEIDGIRYGKINANMERGVGHNRWIEMTLSEGKNREVRRVLEHFGLKVSRLIRIGYGPFALDDLPKGAAIEIETRHVEHFRREIERQNSRSQPRSDGRGEARPDGSEA
ncbi:pseudouridine synthase, partial [Novosphingobium sp. 1949]